MKLLVVMVTNNIINST